MTKTTSFENNTDTKFDICSFHVLLAYDQINCN